jgi:hypothetical protein
MSFRLPARWGIVCKMWSWVRHGLPSPENNAFQHFNQAAQNISMMNPSCMYGFPQFIPIFLDEKGWPSAALPPDCNQQMGEQPVTQRTYAKFYSAVTAEATEGRGAAAGWFRNSVNLGYRCRRRECKGRECRSDKYDV